MCSTPFGISDRIQLACSAARTPRMCSTPFGISDHSRTRSTWRRFTTECSTPFGISDLIHSHPRPIWPPNSMCSTPFGISDLIHTSKSTARDSQCMLCSTPFGISDSHSRRSISECDHPCAQRLSASRSHHVRAAASGLAVDVVLNAFRHLRFTSSDDADQSPDLLSAQRLSASKITSRLAVPTVRRRIVSCAQRLSASKIHQYALGMDPRTKSIVLNAFRHLRSITEALGGWTRTRSCSTPFGI